MRKKIIGIVDQDFTSKNWYAYMHYAGQTITQWGTTPAEAKRNLEIFMEKHYLIKIKFNKSKE